MFCKFDRKKDHNQNQNFTYLLFLFPLWSTKYRRNALFPLTLISLIVSFDLTAWLVFYTHQNACTLRANKCWSKKKILMIIAFKDVNCTSETCFQNLKVSLSFLKYWLHWTHWLEIDDIKALMISLNNIYWIYQYFGSLSKS